VSGDGELEIGWCAFCERDVLAIPDGVEEPVWRCAHCDERLGSRRPIDEEGLAALGYELLSADAPASGCTSCTSGGCGIPRREPNPGARE
jgi:hypothetical protein